MPKRKKYNLIILAGGEDELWCKQYGYKKKAFLPLLGKPMLARIIEAFRRSEYIDNIIVVGPRELNQLEAMRYVRKRLDESRSFVRNLLYAAFYIKAVIYKFANRHNGYLISVCDAAFLTPEMVKATLKTIAEHDPGLGLHYVQKETIADSGYPADKRSYMQIAGKTYTGSNIYYVKQFRKLFGALKDLALVRQYRKDPKKVLSYLGCENKDISGIEQALSKRLSTKVKFFVSPYAEMGVDVDKPADYEFAKRKLSEIESKEGSVNP